MCAMCSLLAIQDVCSPASSTGRCYTATPGAHTKFRRQPTALTTRSPTGEFRLFSDPLTLDDRHDLVYRNISRDISAASRPTNFDPVDLCHSAEAHVHSQIVLREIA